MEVHVTSSEMVKPSSKEVYLRKPFSLSSIDQVLPAHYVSYISFYNKPNDSHFNTTAQILFQLKESLSKALDQFYPLSGRTKDNLYISSYDKGVPYVEARVKGCIADCIAQTELESFNQLLPVQCYCSVPTSTSPQLAIQINIFDCGGIAIALCGSHKVVDATTAATFIKSWAAFNRGSDGKIPNPEMLDEGSRLFPPLDPIPPNYLSSIERFWFEEGWFATKRFMFDDHAITALKFRVKSERLEHPTRAAALAAFLWKHATLASRAAFGHSKPSVLVQSASLRPRMKPMLPNYAIGNLHGIAVSTYNSAERHIELNQFAYLAIEALNVFNHQISLLKIGETKKFQNDQYNLAANIVSRDDVEIFEFVSWLNTVDESGGDFGWGPVTWSCAGCPESRYNSFNNCFIIKATKNNKVIEAWITLDAKTMDFLRCDSEFFEFASPK